MKKLKVLINADCCIESINAQDRNGKHWALYLNCKKYKKYIFCKGTPDPRLELKNKDIKILRLTKNKYLEIFHILFVLTFYHFHIILNMKNSFREMIIIKFIKIFRLRCKVISFAVNLLPYGEINSMYNKFSDYILFNSDYLVANSKRVSETIFEYKSLLVPVVNNFYDMSLFKPFEHSNIRKKIVCHGSMICVKQPFLFANIAKEIPEADFYWYGERRYYNDMKRKASNEKITNLFLPGKCENNKLPGLIAAGDIFLYPSIHDGFPNVVVEAMACGLPVITFDRYGPEAVIDGKTGYVVKSEFEMLDKLKFLLRHEDLIVEFSKNSRKRAMEYDGKKLAPGLEKIIDNIAKR